MGRISFRRAAWLFAAWAVTLVVWTTWGTGLRAAQPPEDRDPPPPAPAPQGQPHNESGGQRAVPPAAAGASREELDLADAAIFPADRATLQRLQKSIELLEQGRYGEAVRQQGAILDRDEDFFFQPDSDRPSYRSAKAEAHRLISQLPREGRETYELLYGAEARRKLDAAMAERDMAGVADVARRRFHTRAGHDATQILAAYHLDHGQALAAALCLQRLRNDPFTDPSFEPALSVELAACWLRTGAAQKAVEVLTALRQRSPEARLTIADRTVPLFGQDAEPLAWLESTLGAVRPRNKVATSDWRLFRGDAARNATSRGGAPLLNPRWHVPTSNDPSVEQLLERLQRDYFERNVPMLPGLHPLVVDGVVLMRTVRNLLAVDARTGKRLWEVPVDDDLNDVDQGDAGRGGSRAQELIAGLHQRVWSDATYGTISSDGHYVYSVEGLELAEGLMDRRAIAVVNRARQAGLLATDPANRMTAHDIRTGKLKWELGGPEGPLQLDLAGSYFLGPPLPVGDQLYGLADLKGEIRLLCLDAGTGSLQWSQQIAVVERQISQDYLRRLAGVTPSYADGVLVCPTAAGAIVAVDITTRSLLWGYRYENRFGGARQAMVARRGVISAGYPGWRNGNTWIDTTLTLADGCVLIAPPESTLLHCLDLADGALRWTASRDGDLYVAAVHNGTVALVGQRGMRMLKLADGQPALSSEPLLWPEDAMPSGRGFLSDGRYFVPLSGGGIVAVDIASGTIVQEVRSRYGRVPGNLISSGGNVISQTAERVECFFQLDDLKRRVATALDANPEDPQALALRGEIRLSDGDLIAATDDLRRAYVGHADPRTRELYIESVFAGLKADFERHRADAAEIEDLIVSPQDRVTYLRLIASGLASTGEYEQALATYLKLIDSALDRDELEQVDVHWSVRRDRWLQAELAELAERVPQEHREVIDRVIAQRLDKAIAAGGADPLSNFLKFFGQHASADAARQQLIERLKPTGALLAIERQVATIGTTADAQQQRQAMAAWAAHLATAERPKAAAEVYRTLLEDHADEVCLDGHTGRELYEALPVDGPVRTRIEPTVSWPAGKVDVDEQSTRSQPYRYVAFQFDGPHGPAFDGITIELDQARSSVLARDAFGEEIWNVSLVEGGRPPVYPSSPGVNFCRAIGHLLVLNLGQHLFAVDTLGEPGRGAARVLWTRELSDAFPGVPAARATHPQNEQMVWGAQRTRPIDAVGRPVGTVGIVRPDFVCFQQQRIVVAVDPHTGSELWTRSGIAPGADVFGDDDYVFVVPPDETEAMVLRALDGKHLGTRHVPRDDQRMTTQGRLVLSWEEEADGPVVRLSDPWDGQGIWEHPFQPMSRACLIENDAVGIMQRDGQFTLLRIADGVRLIEADLEPEAALEEIHMLRSRERYVLVVNREVVGGGVFVRPMPGLVNNPGVHGQIYGFDRATGQPLWSTPMDRQGLQLDQPVEVPLLAFCSHVYEQSGNGQHNSAWSVICLDKLSGRIVYQHRAPRQQINSYAIAADPEHKAITLEIPHRTITFRYTDEPDDPNPRPVETEDDGNGETDNQNQGGNQ